MEFDFIGTNYGGVPNKLACIRIKLVLRLAT